jgi:flagellar biosynthesis/type III secretory pathway protein FliH
MKSHSFPVFERESACPLTTHRECCDRFKPLYGAGHAGLGTAADAENQDTIGQVRQKGFLCGLETGRQQARDQVQEEMAPDIQAFALEVQQLTDFLARMEENATRHILAMALSLAEKILGGPADLTLEDLDSLRGDLKDCLAGVYRLQLTLNPADRTALAQRLPRVIAELPAGSSINISADGSVPGGSVTIQATPQSLLPHDMLAQSLDSILAQVSTK